MKTFSREELVLRTKEVFERNENCTALIAVEDGQIFQNNEKSMGMISGHCKENNFKHYIINRAEAMASKEVEKPYEEMTAKDLKKVCVDKGIEFPKSASKEDLLKLIKDAPATTDTEDGKDGISGANSNVAKYKD